MQQLRAILFDLDGTLINSVDHIVDCWQHTVRTCLGREITREEILPTVGRSLPESFEEIAPGRSGEMREVYRAYQKTTHDLMVTLVSGTHETLDTLRARGYRLGLVTSKGIVVATEGLDLFGLAPYFETLVTYEDSERHKPFPDPLLVARERMQLDPAQMLYVGDAVFDIEAGKAAGLRTAAVLWGSGSEEALINSGPDYMAASMPELVALVRAAALGN